MIVKTSLEFREAGVGEWTSASVARSPLNGPANNTCPPILPSGKRFFDW
jgi:hypothetical protein